MEHFKLGKGILMIMCIILLIFCMAMKIKTTSETSIGVDSKEATVMNITEISNKLIRFHVIANSDSSGDQKVKLQVRDAILNSLGGSLEKCKTRKDSLIFLKNRTNEIEVIADQVLVKDGKGYKAKAMIGDFNFPIKSYGKITLPPGKYTALRVVLGDGEGRNWWCVMFPPLCFIDITRGLTSAETDESLGKVLNPKEITSITNTKVKNNEKTIVKNQSKYLKPKVQIRFKVIDIIKNLL